MVFGHVDGRERAFPDEEQVGPNIESTLPEPMPNSSMLVLPMTRPPASVVLCTTVALYFGLKGSNILEQQVVGKSLVQKLSLMAINFPRILESEFGCTDISDN